MNATNLKEYLCANTLQDDSADVSGMLLIKGVTAEQIRVHFQEKEFTLTPDRIKQIFPFAEITEIEL